MKAPVRAHLKGLKMQIATVGNFLFAYWWLVFPLGWFISAGFGSFMRYKRTQSKLDLMKAYAASGKEPPAELVAALSEKDSDLDDDDTSEDGDIMSGSSRAFVVILFIGFASIFAYEGYSGLIGIGEVAYFVSLIFVVLAIAFLGSGLFARKPKRD
jgi:hypothetical protein